MEKTEPGYAQQMIEARGQGHERLGNGNKGKVLDQKMRRCRTKAKMSSPNSKAKMSPPGGKISSFYLGGWDEGGKT
jgi:hypothetical protein